MRALAGLLASCCGVLLGCAGPQAVQLYSGPSRHVEEVSVLRAVQHGSTAGAFAYITSADNAESGTPQHSVAESFADNYPSELRVLPGRYEIRLQCQQQAPSKLANVALPGLTLHVGAGFTYELHCDPSRSSARKASVKWRRYRTTELAPIGH